MQQKPSVKLRRYVSIVAVIARFNRFKRCTFKFLYVAVIARFNRWTLQSFVGDAEAGGEA